jgi:hypothetical protein
VVPTTANPVAPAVEIDVRTMHKGQCYNSAMDPDRGSVTSCDESHDGEVIGMVHLSTSKAALPDVQLAALCRPLLNPRLAELVDQEACSLIWTVPISDGDSMTCRLERGTHEAPLSGRLLPG